MSDIAFKNLRGDLYYSHPVSSYTSWRVGGPAERFYRPADLQDLQHFLSQLPEREPLTWLGLGSNVLVRDAGIKGTVILTLQRLNELTQLSATIIRAACGVTCVKLARYASNFGFEDAAFFVGIPGTVGGALAMNAGAFGEETWRHVKALQTIDRSGHVHEHSPEAFEVHYREVLRPNREFFLSADFFFTPGSPIQAKEKISQLLKDRQMAQPIGTYNCGSVFRNPPGDHAARLIEAAGLKGKRCGGAMISYKHANFILNDQQATAHDIEQLINDITKTVAQLFQIELVPEVHIIGNKE